MIIERYLSWRILLWKSLYQNFDSYNIIFNFFESFQQMPKKDGFQDSKHSEEEISIMQTMKYFLFKRNYALVTSLKLGILQAVTLIIIEQLQKISIITRYSVNPTLLGSPEMYYINQLSRIMVLDIFQIEDGYNLIITLLLILGQVLIVLVIAIPFKGEILNQLLSKYMFTFMEIILTVPSIILSVNFIMQGVNVGPNVILYAMTITTNIVYESMQLECSFERENINVFVRTARPITLKVLNLIMVSFFPILTHLLYPTSFAFYSFAMLLIELYNWLYYLHKFIYFNELLMHVRGFMLTINISANICYLTIYILDSAIISQNILLFITTFSIFLGNFFITYRKYLLENTIINKDLKGENEIGLYCTFYWHCFSKITEKKKELYVSSLLKKHTNQCLDLSCCCKNRQYLYDNNLKAFGNPNIQPHFDKIFIRHFIKKLLLAGYQKFNKSSILAFMLSNYNIQIVEMVTQTMKQIQKLSKMQQKRQLYFTEEFLLFSLKMKTHDKIISMNFKRGNIDLESVKEFDEQLISLNDYLRSSVKMYHNLWKQLQNPKLNEAIMYDICKKNLELMFSIEKNYKSLKRINTESSELKAIMLFYSRLILHDIHLLSQVKKDLKNGHERTAISSTLELSNIHLFGNNTTSFISLQDARIKWSNKNANQFFEYSKNEFHNLTIKNLMPKHFAEKHDGYVQKWKQTGHTIKLNRTIYLWGSTKSGDCFSLLMFVKVISLPHQQDYGFFSSMEKLDDQSQIICSSYGEVYGSGRLFSKITKINPRMLQEIKMNIQVFIPYSFEYFLEYFYPKNAKLKSIKRNFEVRREGYFPNNLELVLNQLFQQRTLFFKKHQKGQNFSKQYLNFIRQQMQELTCLINGEYISFSIQPFKTSTFERENENVIVLRISNAKKNSIDKYYTQLEKMINKLQILSQQDNTKRKKTFFTDNKSDFFKAFLNPKRLKRLLQHEKDEAHINNASGQSIQLKRMVSCELKSPSTIFAHRKRLALGAKIQIKSDRVRYNFFKMKKVLLEEGVISRYTYNILIGKSFAFSFRSQPKLEKQDAQEISKTMKQFEQDRDISEDQNMSIAQDSDGDLTANKENDNETFNSASSSATFISMTNHVKMFKIKLRSLNTPRLLLILNLAVLVTLIGCISGYIYLTYSNIYNINLGIKQFQNNLEANIILDSLFLGQCNINNLNYQPNNTYYIAQRGYYIDIASNLYQKQMYLRAQYKLIDPQILSYLSMKVSDQQNLTVIEFIQLILNQMVSRKFNHVLIYFRDSMSDITLHSSSNIFFNRIRTNVSNIFLIYLVVAFSLFVITLPIVYKLKIKIKEIYDLLSKISTNDKQKYHKHFVQLNDQFQKNEDLNYAELNNLVTIYDGRPKFIKSNTRVGISQTSLSRAEQKQRRSQAQNSQEDESSISTNKAIYFKITGLYLILLASIIFNYIYVNSYHRMFLNANDEFISLFNAKTLLTSRIVSGQYELMGYDHQMSYNSTSVEFVQILYNTYNLDGISQDYREYVFNLITGKPCRIISHLLKSQQLIFCSKLNNYTFDEGGMDNLFYSQRKIEQKVNEYYLSRGEVPNDESALTYPSYFFTQEFFQLNVGFFFSTLMISDLYDKIYVEINSFASNYRFQFYLSFAVCLLLILLFGILWIYHYMKLAEDASYINAFLLLIPFDVLSENPYIKLYIKNEFDYKTSY